MIHRASEMHVEDERHAARFAEAGGTRIEYPPRPRTVSAPSGECVGPSKFLLMVAGAEYISAPEPVSESYRRRR